MKEIWKCTTRMAVIILNKTALNGTIMRDPQ